MATLPVFDRNGAKVDTYEVDPAAIAPRISKQLLHDVVVMYQANRRQGTSRTKTRGEVAGSTRKMYRQKGTGNARAGSRRSGIRRGGGHIHAKRGRNYGYRLPKKAVRAATRMAIATKILAGNMLVIDQLAFEQPRTKEMVAILKSLKLADQTTLVTTAVHDRNVYRSARNIQDVTVSPVADLNALSVLQPRRMLITRAALDALCAQSRSNDRHDLQPMGEGEGDA
jgi:large subunit ribosomal protein L4